MAKIVFSLLFLLILCANVFAAQNNVLNVDRAIPNSMQLSFPNDNNITPKKSDFSIVNYVLMSNEEGERWAVITLTNLASGKRELNQDHLLALFADGSRLTPNEFKLGFNGNQTQSVTVSFAEYKFPILSVYSSNDQ
ncbi:MULTISPECIES: hypothetical protein [unclassified Pseudoalteromonas]|uniref:hypothetical protein n=1 Tax=unclassified Pseudoalteromonas TaxID=194690 RepID=UPI0006D68CC5|nr:hypothetical protein AN393_00882 [Pseudoalteromonas sp. P1-25]KPZ59413.1 hypothetical protein AN391_01120 [Pseudoalteromonas sp. P1-13-1a]KPZ60321.1 hypothetical protein AN389_02419 [Pseudoalteromonas sp. P1-7a]